MSEMTAIRMRRRHSRALALFLLASAGWLVAAAALWRTQVPADLAVPSLDERRYFGAETIRRAVDFERLFYVLWAVSLAATLAALVALVRPARGWARSIGIGRVGTAVVLGLLALTVVWAVELPADAVSHWWARRHGLVHDGWSAWLGNAWGTLLGQAVAALILIALVVGLAGRFRRAWWALAAPVLVALALLGTFVGGYLAGLGTDPVERPALRRSVSRLEQRVGAEGTPVRVEDVSDSTSLANAFASGLGPSTRVVLWNTILERPFTVPEVRFVVAHELGHVARRHLWKGVAWFALFAVPTLALLALVTERRGGLADPGVLPFALLAVVLIQQAMTPLENLVSRRYESEADWVALQATRDPAAGRGLFSRLATTSRSDPSPPTWAYVLFDTHPTIMQRIAMTEAWKKRNR